MVLATDQLPGGTAQDYHDHITDSIDHLCYIYTELTGSDYQETRRIVIGNISNTMTDRAIVNYATIELLNEYWNITLNELNCHLHPLDTFASTCRSTLKCILTVYITTETSCMVLAIDQLPGGTAQDYHDHITDSIDHLCYIYTELTGSDYQETRRIVIGNISNTMTDRAIVNYATIELLNESWNITLNELNCSHYQETHQIVIGNIANTMTDRAIVNYATIELLNESWNTTLNELNLLKKSRIICANPNLRPTQKPLSTSEREQLYMEIESLRRERNEARANILALEQLVHAKPLSLSYVKETMKIMYYRAFLSERLESDFRYWRSRNSKQRFSVNELLSQLFNSEEDDVEDDPDYEV
ncbi:hypothetical protein GQR58_001809 [Nymphon striatum]|nr:hypothetical protein GQR58_001809 [Nymphon striatum]